ncbi:MAG: polyamine ABC transporter substrate-binding protein [Acidimicrobiia bacterium]
MNRRDFLIRAGLVGGGIVIAPSLLAACASGGSSGGPNSVSISNWTSYFSAEAKKAFERASGLKLTYTEDINDNNEYFAKIQPNLSKGKSIGRDGIVLTDWMANRLINQLQWVQPLDAEKMTNKKNLRAALASPGFDPTRTYSMPWQSGFAGFAYNTDLTGGKDVKTWKDFLAVKGNKTLLSEMRDTMGIIMMAMGISITKPEFVAAQPAFNDLERAVKSGQVNGFNGNEYVNDLAAGNLAACIAWSGDVAQIARDNPKVKFAIPESGGTLWSDNFMIPIMAAHVANASEFINFFYDPANAALLTAEVQYVSPVNGVAEELTKMGGDAAKLVDDPLVVPTDEFLKTVSIFGPIPADQQDLWDKRFSEILGTG